MRLTHLSECQVWANSLWVPDQGQILCWVNCLPIRPVSQELGCDELWQIRAGNHWDNNLNSGLLLLKETASNGRRFFRYLVYIPSEGFISHLLFYLISFQQRMDILWSLIMVFAHWTTRLSGCLCRIVRRFFYLYSKDRKHRYNTMPIYLNIMNPGSSSVKSLKCSHKNEAQVPYYRWNTVCYLCRQKHFRFGGYNFYFLPWGSRDIKLCWDLSWVRDLPSCWLHLKVWCFFFILIEYLL